MFRLLVLVIFAIMTLPSQAEAKVEVNISNNLGGSNNSVQVKSEAMQNQTDIVINDNGEKKEYHGSGEGDIELKSGDGKSTVQINNNSVSNNPTQNSKSDVSIKTNITVNSNTSETSASADATVAGIFKDNSEQQRDAGFWNYMKSQIDKFLELFF